MAKIFESPNNGKTIFSRPIREIIELDDNTQQYPNYTSTEIVSLTDALKRNLVQEDLDYFAKKRKLQQEEKLWLEIRHAAKSNNELQEILNQAIMLHTLCKEG